MESIKIHGKDYITVNERLKFFRDNYPKHSLQTTVIKMEDNIVLIKAVILDNTGANPVIIATGHAFEEKGSSNINKTSYVENCETSAWGRCLANFGIGIDTAVASYEEVANAIKQQGEGDKEFDAAKEEMIKGFEVLVGVAGGKEQAYKVLGKTKKDMLACIHSNDVGTVKAFSKLISAKVDEVG